jgi:quercetin dioxygenase-like cupin family protein
MNRRSSWPWSALALLLILHTHNGIAAAAEAVSHPVTQNLEDMKFGPTPGFPMCASGSVQSGNPAAGPSVLLGKLAAGCVVPWHWHTPNEYLMMVSGVAEVQPNDGKPFTLRSGGFALMPSRHVHQFRCTTDCTLFLHSDAALDTHYVDAQGKELSADEALKVVKETLPRP